jgi:putative sigma-54 modulation protein
MTAVSVKKVPGTELYPALKNTQHMNYTENYRGIKLDIQSMDLQLSKSVHESIRNMIDRLEKYAGTINFADVYLKTEANANVNDKFVKVRLGVPGPDAFAEDTGEYWETTIKSVTEKIEKQLRKTNGK